MNKILTLIAFAIIIAFNDQDIKSGSKNLITATTAPDTLSIVRHKARH